MAVIGAVACQRTSAEPNAAALVTEPYFLRGTITEAGQAWGYRMYGEPGTSSRANEAYFRITPQTELLRADGSPATAADLIVGRSVSLWITGPIAESHPVQVGAKRIVLE
jgi:hypothetical protein